MKKQSFLSLLFIATLICLTTFACKSDDDGGEDTTAPTLTLDTPTDGQEFKNGDEISIEGKVTDQDLHELEIKLVNKATGAVLFTESPTTHDMTAYDFHVHYEVTGITEHTVATLTIEVADHSDNVTKKSVEIHIEP